jgi:hypothetical protein
MVAIRPELAKQSLLTWTRPIGLASSDHMTGLILKRASGSRPSGHWNENYDVLADGKIVGRIYEQGGVGSGRLRALHKHSRRTT